MKTFLPSLLWRGTALGFGATVLVFGLSGCNKGSSTGGNTTGGTATGTSGDSATLTIISPHNREIQTEFDGLWKKQNPSVAIKWLDQGGTSDDLNFVRDQFASQGKDKGIGIDLFFGGGNETFNELESDGLLTPLPSDYGVPPKLNGVPLHGKNNDWTAAALSGFGILYNKQIATRDKLPVPQTWIDLANPQLRDRIELADPRHSGSAHTIYEIILQTNGWEKGWKLLTAMAGNARTFATSSSAPLTDVQNGEAVFTTAIDFYASSAIAQAGEDKLAYIEPKGQYIVTADPIAILAGAPNSENAKKFVALVMSESGQKLWFLPKGVAGGPVNSTLYRLPAVSAVYASSLKGSTAKVDPYKMKATAAYDSEKAATRRLALDDLIGSVLVDNHDAIKAYWQKNPNLDSSGYVPLSEAAFMKIAPQWKDARLASATKESWTNAARAKFGG